MSCSHATLSISTEMIKFLDSAFVPQWSRECYLQTTSVHTILPMRGILGEAGHVQMWRTWRDTSWRPDEQIRAYADVRDLLHSAIIP